VAEAEEIIDAGVKSFVHWLDKRSDVPLIQQLNQQAEAWRAAELQRAQKLLAKGEPIEAVLEAMAKGLTQKMLHGAYQQLQAGDAQERADTSAAIERLFLRNQGSAPQTASHANEADPEQ
jgi:glutamyl-tRNA reductase